MNNQDTINPYDTDDFTRAYLVCALWASLDDNDNPLDTDYDIDDIEQESLRLMIKDCRLFQQENKELLKLAYEYNNQQYDGSMAGHDFWLTRNGHGAGFWDRGLGDIGKVLSDKCGIFTPYSTVYLYVQDNQVQCERG